MISRGAPWIPDAKSDGNREFILSPTTMDAIGHYLTTERAEDNDPVLFIPRSPRRTSRLSAAMIRKMLAVSCDKVGIERFGLHEFRRSLVARFHQLGVEPLVIQRALGYAKAESMIRVLPPRATRNTV